MSHRIGDLLGERPFAQSARGFSAGRAVTVAGLIDEIRKRGTRVSVSLDDRSGRIEVTLFDEVFQRHRDLIVKDALVLVEGLLRFDEFSDGWRMAARRITDLDEALAAQARMCMPVEPMIVHRAGSPSVRMPAPSAVQTTST